MRPPRWEASRSKAADSSVPAGASGINASAAFAPATGGQPPKSIPAERTYWYLSEDYSFCERARQCGYKIMEDTSIRLWHIGHYAYGWEDAGQDRLRHDSFLFLFGDGEKEGVRS